jgi:hypothetical protein
MIDRQYQNSTIVHDATQHLTNFIKHLHEEYHIDDLGAIAAATSPPGWPLDTSKLKSADDIAKALLTGENKS